MAEICPIPHVSQALEPYILPRDSVSSIRQSLHSHLERQLRLEASQTLSLANITNPPLTQTLPEPPASVTGVRRAYWRALRAHQVAREKYEGLRAELDVVVGNAGGSAAGADGVVGDGGDLLLPLLRARERRRKLGAVERAVEAVEKEGKGVVGAKIDEVVRKAAGDLPVLPSQRGMLGGGSGREEGELRMMELKKAILQAQATIEKCNGSRPEVNAQGSGAGELFALQQARNELISWIERQLAIIGDAEADSSEESSSPIKKTSHEEEETPIATPDEIVHLYDRYLQARRTLLDTVQAPEDVSPLASAPDSPKQSRPSQENDPATTTATTLLPYIEPLLAAKASEQTIIHQAAYVRRQLGSADSSSERLLRRLADESHLVHPGASRGRDWARAGEEAGEATRELVFARAKAGEDASREADVTLGKLKGVTVGLERLAGMQ